MKRKRPITVVDYDPTWPDTFARLEATLRPAVGDIAVSIEHVGSTSVPGLAAKPVIDISIVLPSQDLVPQAIKRLASIGYTHKGDQGVPGREAFDEPKGTPRHNLYVCVDGIIGLRNHLALRDYLRANPDEAGRYGELKKQLADRFPDDIDSYVDGKTDLILDFLEKAGISEDERNEIRGVNEKD